MMNVTQPCVPERRCVTRGTAAAAARAATMKKYIVALMGGFLSTPCWATGPGSSGRAMLPGTALTRRLSDAGMAGSQARRRVQPESAVARVSRTAP